MTELDGWSMTGKLDNFPQGASALRNTREWAKEQREEIAAAANAKARKEKHSDLELFTPNH